MLEVLLLKLSDVGHIWFGKNPSSHPGLVLLQNAWTVCLEPHIVEILWFVELIDDATNYGVVHTKFLSDVSMRESILCKDDNACNFGGEHVDHVDTMIVQKNEAGGAASEQDMAKTLAFMTKIKRNAHTIFDLYSIFYRKTKLSQNKFIYL